MAAVAGDGEADGPAAAHVRRLALPKRKRNRQKDMRKERMAHNVTISVCAINLRKCKTAMAELNKRRSNIALITEPYTVRSEVALVDKAAFKLYSAIGSKPRACVRTAKDVPAWLVNEFTSRDICTIAIKINGRLTYVTSAYLDINLPVRQTQLVNLISHCELKRIALVVAMDSNSHSGLWGCPDTNARGEELENLISETNLTVMNVGTEPTFVTSRASSIIDVTVVNAKAFAELNLSEWEVDTSNPSFSDHRYITFVMGHYSPVVKQCRNMKKANWGLFRAILSNQKTTQVEVGGANLDVCAEQLEARVGIALNAACPLRKAVDRQPMSWWTNELESLRRQVRPLCNKQHNNPHCREEYQTKLKQYRQAIRKAKKASWRDFCSKADTAKDVSSMVKLLKPATAAGIGILKRDGAYVSTPAEALHTLMDQHFPNSREAGEEQDSNVTRAVYDEVEDFITAAKIKHSFRSFGAMKAAGPDGFKPIVLQNLSEGVINHLEQMYKTVVRTGYTPIVWRQMEVIFLPKAGKDDYGVAKAYRPITLSNFLLKGLERIIQWYIKVQLPNPLYAQHAYTTGLSTETALSEVIDHIESAVLRGEQALTVSLDCSGAFDTIDFDSARSAMERKSIAGTIVRWYDRLLRGRRVTANLQGEKSERIPARGSPQGGVLSPQIWLLIMDTLLTQFKGTAIKAVCYADDVFLILTGRVRSVMVTVMQQALDTVLAWGRRNGLSFNPTKTVAVVFTKSTRSTSWAPLRMEGKTIAYSDSVKHLGVTLSKRLSWTEHLKERCAKGMRLMNWAKALVGAKWGLSPEKILWVYTAMVRPMISYGALIWAPVITKTAAGSFSKLQRLTLLAMSHAMRSTPTAGMEAMLGLVPLDLEVEANAMKARVRTRVLSKDKWDGLGNKAKGHRRHWDDLLKPIAPTNLPTDMVRRTMNWERREEILEPEVTLFTDGSKEGRATGFGWVALKNHEVIAEAAGNLGGNCTIAQAEMYAVTNSLQWLKGAAESLQIKCGLICTDSQATTSAIYAASIEAKTTMECVEALAEVNKHIAVEVRWVKGHNGLNGNEKADSLAKQGRMLETPEERLLPLALGEIKKAIDGRRDRRWQERWEARPDCRTSKLFMPSVNSQKIKPLSKLERDQIRILFAAGTGHGLFAAHLAKWRDQVDPECHLCLEEDETSFHLWDNCPALTQQRLDRMTKEREKTSSAHKAELEIIKFFSLTPLVEVSQANEELLLE